MKIAKRIFSITAVAILILSLFTVPVFAEGEYNSIDNNYDTLSYNADITLSEKNVYHIEETIVVNFKNLRHGIYRYIPYKGIMSYDENGVTVDAKYRSKITNVQVNGGKFEKNSENGNIVLQIGDKDEFVNGEKTYNIAFDYDAGDDKISSFDQIYINLIPHGWRTAINQASFSLTLPKEVPAESLQLFSGEFGSANQGKFDLKADGNVITGVSTMPLEAFEGATIYSKVAEGYFTGERTDAPLIALMWIIILAIPILAILLYILLGRDERIIPVVTVSPPSDLPPAEVGYIMDSIIEDKDMFSLIIYWADKGYLSIAEDTETAFVLTKLSSLPESANLYEKTMFNGLFEKGDVINTTELKTKFYPKLVLAKTQLTNKFSKKNGTARYTSSSVAAQVIIAILAILPFGIASIVGGYLSIADDLYTVFSIVSSVMVLGSVLCSITLSLKWYVLTKSAKVGGCIGCGVLFAVGALITAGLGLWQLPSILPIIVGAISTAIAGLLACVMPKRTQQCNDWFGELLGLKEFIEVAEKERIEQLVYEDPGYFYSILPYAYVLGVSDAWAERFENIKVEPPVWYNGGYYQPNLFSTYIFMHSFNDCMRNMQNTLSIPPAQTNSGSGSGGFSAGGFSGGGFSGGGGGSW